MKESASVVGKRLAHKLVIWNSARKVQVRQGDVSFLKRNFIVNTLFKVVGSTSVLYKFALDGEVLRLRIEKLF